MAGEIIRQALRATASQRAALAHPAMEVLIGGDDGHCGASYCLRVAAIVEATKAKSPVRVALIAPDASELRRTHLEGPSGLHALLAGAQARGGVEISAAEAKFANGSVIRWSGSLREVELARLFDEAIDVALIDDADRIPEETYVRLVDRVISGSKASTRRIIAATSSRSQGWIERRWRVPDPGRAFVQLHRHELPSSVAAPAGVPSYRDFLVGLHGSRFAFYRDTEVLVDAIDRWARLGEFDHLAVFCPSQHGKSTAGPKNAVPYILGMRPADWCSITSYDEALAKIHSRAARDNYIATGRPLAEGKRAASEWGTVAGGGCWSAGVSGGVIGRTATWCFGDDWDKGWLDAIAKAGREKKHQFYSSSLRSRESTFAEGGMRQRVCITATRWDASDTAAYALAKGVEAGENWGILVLPAIYDPAIAEGYREMYPNATILDDWREPGEPLRPSNRDAAAWGAIRKMRGVLIWETECQQLPRGVEHGGLFEADWFRPLEIDPAYAGGADGQATAYQATCRAWDVGATEGAGDYTAGAKVSSTPDGDVIVRHVARAQLGPRRVQQLMAAYMILDGPEVKIRIPKDPAAGGKASAEGQVAYLRMVAQKAGVPLPQIEAKPPRAVASATASAKAVRAHDLRSFAMPPGKGLSGGVSFVAAKWTPSIADRIPDFEARCQAWPELREIARIVAEPDSEWWAAWIKEMQSFTGQDGREDDQVDATVDAFEEVAPGHKPMQFF